jgi:hypothetical protein
MTPEEQIKKDLAPMLDVFGGADCGVSFAVLKFQILPKIYAGKDPSSKAVVAIVQQFARLCKISLGDIKKP